jgi:hypothetical protein
MSRNAVYARRRSAAPERRPSSVRVYAFRRASAARLCFRAAAGRRARPAGSNARNLGFGYRKVGSASFPCRRGMLTFLRSRACQSADLQWTAVLLAGIVTRMDHRWFLALPVALGFALLSGFLPDASAQPTPSERAPAGSEPVVERGLIAGVAAVAPKRRPQEARSEGIRCTKDRAHCITLENYTADVCRTIEALARDHDLDGNFFARLIWRESLFDASAVSPAGAEGIAQFMPGTAELRGLEDAFNPAEALRASAEYLSELTGTFGNLGIAAVAYNGGERRAERFLAGEGILPLETRAYVYAITGHSATTWRDAPPMELDLSFESDRTFQEGCIARAESRRFRKFREPLLPWGVIVTSNISRESAERHVARLQNRHGSVLRGETVAYSYGRTPGMRRPLHLAQIGRTSRSEADALCERLRAIGGACMVLRNQVGIIGVTATGAGP